MEKKRRDRINKCLDELKDLILISDNSDGVKQYQKLEKAEILEMAVNYVKSLQRNKQISFKSNCDSSFLESKLHSSYLKKLQQHVNDLQAFIKTLPNIQLESKVAILNYMNQLYNQLTIASNNTYEANASSFHEINSLEEKRNMRYSPYLIENYNHRIVQYTDKSSKHINKNLLINNNSSEFNQSCTNIDNCVISMTISYPSDEPTSYQLPFQAEDIKKTLFYQNSNALNSKIFPFSYFSSFEFEGNVKNKEFEKNQHLWRPWR